MRIRVDLGIDGEGRWYADLVDIPGCIGHGHSPRSALADALEQAGDAFEVEIREDMEFEFRAQGNA